METENGLNIALDIWKTYSYKSLEELCFDRPQGRYTTKERRLLMPKAVFCAESNAESTPTILGFPPVLSQSALVPASVQLEGGEHMVILAFASSQDVTKSICDGHARA